MKKQFFISITDGEIVNKVTIRKAIEDLPTGRYLFKIERKNQRTLPQNSYYWGIVVPLVKDGLRDIGYEEVRTDEQAHEIMKHLFLKQNIVNKQTGEVIEVAGSTARLTTLLFSDYLESIYKWSAEYLGLNIPAPGEQMEIFQD